MKINENQSIHCEGKSPSKNLSKNVGKWEDGDPRIYLFLIELQGVNKILCFSLKCCDFSELCLFCCSAGVLPAI